MAQKTQRTYAEMARSVIRAYDRYMKAEADKQIPYASDPFSDETRKAFALSQRRCNAWWKECQIWFGYSEFTRFTELTEQLREEMIASNRLLQG